MHKINIFFFLFSPSWLNEPMEIKKLTDGVLQGQMQTVNEYMSFLIVFCLRCLGFGSPWQKTSEIKKKKKLLLDYA